MKIIASTLFNFTAGFIVCLLLITQISFDRRRSGEINRTDEPIYQWHAPDLPAKIDFAGEAVPLDKWDIKERLDRELLFNYYWQNNVLFVLKMSNRYFPVIEERLKANGIPEDFKYLCIAESNLLANATSRVGAVGFWQFMEGTAPAYNLEVNKQVDKRREIIESTDAACKYLKAAYNKFGSWTAAAASYNCGQAGYATQANMQRTKYYYDLLLPEETNRYIFRILAFKHLVENAKELGFNVDEEDLYAPISTKKIRVDTTIKDLVQFAINNGTNYKTLKLLNPWLRSNSLPVKTGKVYEIILPQ
jgi:membrane-bound lytic murein transglycosylase D